MPPLRLFIIPPTDNSLSYSAAKVKDFWAKEGPYLVVLGNFASSAAYEIANRTVLGPRKRLGSVAGFMSQSAAYAGGEKASGSSRRNLDAASFSTDNGRGWKDASRRYLVPFKTREEFGEQEIQNDK